MALTASSRKRAGTGVVIDFCVDSVEGMKKLLLLGAGRIGQVHANNVHHSSTARLAGVVDVNKDAAHKLAEATGARTFDSVDAALTALTEKGAELSGVMICTSTDTHVEMITKAAAWKLPIFCEKPVDLDMKKVERCLADVKKAGVPLLMGFNRRFDPSFRSLRERVRAGEIGAVESITITSRDPQPPPPAYVKVSGGLFRDMMIHDFDMARYLAGDDAIVSVFAAGSVLVDPEIGKAGDVDTATVVMKTARGAQIVISNSRRATYGYDQRIEVFGAKGALLANNPTPTSVTALGHAGVVGDKPFHFFLERYADAYRAELAHFIDVIDGKAQPMVDGDDGRRALALADAANESLRANRAVEVKL